jgi:2-methylthioadenine synthetase
VDARTIYNRKRKLMSIQRGISRARNKKLIGMEFPVLIEGPSQETDLLWECRMPSQAPEIDGVCYINDFGETAPLPGQIRRLRVTESHDYDLVGMLTDEAVDDLAPLQANPFQILTGNRPESAARLVSPHV